MVDEVHKNLSKSQKIFLAILFLAAIAITTALILYFVHHS